MTTTIFLKISRFDMEFWIFWGIIIYRIIGIKDFAQRLKNKILADLKKKAENSIKI